MLLTALFVFLLAVTVALTGLQLIGFEVLNSLIVMLVVDFIALGANLQVKRNNPSNSPSHNIVPRLETIEKACSDILTHVNTVSIKDDLQKNKDDMTYLLERIARKTMDLEEKIDTFGKTLTTSMLDINGRVKKLESSEPVLEGLEPEVDNRLSVGEIVYVDEDSS